MPRPHWRKITIICAAAIILGTAVGCGGSDSSSTTTPPISKAELDALDQAHVEFHSLLIGQGASLSSCNSLSCFHGVVTSMQGEVAVLDSDLQHAEEASTGSCKVAIQTAQSSLLAVKQQFDAINQALDNYDFGAISGSAAPMRSFNSDLDAVDSACGGASAPNA